MRGKGRVDVQRGTAGHKHDGDNVGVREAQAVVPEDVLQRHGTSSSGSSTRWGMDHHPGIPYVNRRCRADRHGAPESTISYWNHPYDAYVLGNVATRPFPVVHVRHYNQYVFV